MQRLVACQYGGTTMKARGRCCRGDKAAAGGEHQYTMSNSQGAAVGVMPPFPQIPYTGDAVYAEETDNSRPDDGMSGFFRTGFRCVVQRLAQRVLSRKQRQGREARILVYFESDLIPARICYRHRVRRRLLPGSCRILWKCR